mgnify:CR=1 FL=1
MVRTLAICALVASSVPLACARLNGALQQVEVSVRDNKVDFDGVDTLSFDLDHYSISDGQPFDGVSVSGNTLDIRAGRHGSSGPAADFGAGITQVNAMGLKTAWPHLTLLPNDLNFVVFGNLTFTFSSGETATCDGIRLGQGHHGFDNNWWIGDKQCLTIPDSNKFTCDLCHPAIDFFAGDDDHSFQVRLSNPSAAKSSQDK